MASTLQALGFIFTFVFLILLLASLIPAVMVAQEGPQNQTLSMDLGVQNTITADLKATVSNVTLNNGNGTINVTVFNGQTGETHYAKNLSETQSEKLVFDNANVTVTNEEILSIDKAVVKFQYPIYHGWPNGAKTIIENSMLVTLSLFVMTMIAAMLTIWTG